MKQMSQRTSRRELLKLFGVGGVGLVAATATSLRYAEPAYADQSTAETENSEAVSSEAALQRLLDGNQRFMQQKRQYPHQAAGDLQAVATVQHPFATLLTCADSRVPGEIIFDQGIGDLFDVRVAGNVVTPEVLGSLEYAAALLGTRLIMVVGHERCGAVTAAIQGGALPGHVSTFVKAIKPALASIKTKSADVNQQIDQAVTANVQYQVEQLKQNSSVLTQLELERKLKIVGGRYDLDTGAVTLVT
ncbi:carbonic anhydrase [Trichocoleus desertorum AS-A10]|uniref:carbonic anhydrase n=1 Tax=Trichocoleus desertorum TaxID=1481672 RepID=UPI00329A1825